MLARKAQVTLELREAIILKGALGLTKVSLSLEEYLLSRISYSREAYLTLIKEEWQWFAGCRLQQNQLLFPALESAAAYQSFSLMLTKILKSHH